MENLGLNNSQGWDEEKTKGRIITKGGQKKQVKLGFTRACRSIDKLGKKWLKTR